MCRAIYFQCKNEAKGQCHNPDKKDVQPPGFPQKRTMIFGGFKNCDYDDSDPKPCKAAGEPMADTNIIGLSDQFAFQCAYDCIKEITTHTGRAVGEGDKADILDRQNSNARYYEILETCARKLHEGHLRRKAMLRKEMEDRKREFNLPDMEEEAQQAEEKARQLERTIHEWMSSMPKRRFTAASSGRVTPSTSGSAAPYRSSGKRGRQSTNDSSRDKSVSRHGSQTGKDRVATSYEPSDAGESQTSKKKGQASAGAAPAKKKQRTPRKNREEDDQRKFTQ